MKKLILVKLGGSVITDKNKEYYAREKNIVRFAKELKSVLKITPSNVIIGHGAGSFAHIPAKQYKTKEGIINKKSVFGAAVTEEAAKMLNAIVTQKFISQKVPVYSFSPGSLLVSDSKVYIKSYIEPVQKALEIGIVPIVYGDVVLDRKIGFTIFSTEKVLAVMAKNLCEDHEVRMIYVTDVPGVLDEKGKVIPQITKDNFGELKASITGAKGVDVTGGMLHKVEEALSLAQELNIQTKIINGNKSGNLKKAILGKSVLGTLIK